jgi:CheY-like chemotaxis protein
MPVHKIVICDDSEIVLEFAQMALEEAGFVAVTTSNPLSLAHLIRREMPDLLVLDVNMPSIAGDMVAQIIGARGVTQKLTVVLHSDLPPEELEQRARKAGAAGWISKTGDEAAFVEAVRKFLP